jgi:hypothetical protein
MNEPRPLWRIRHELFWAELFARLAGPERDDEPPRFELHADLARLYFELEDAYARRGDALRAGRAHRRGLFHEYFGTPPDPDPDHPAADGAVLPLEAARYQRTHARRKPAPV